MKKISILGCGWLGFPLAKEMIERGFDIKGSTTTIDKMALLKAHKIESYQITLSEKGVEGTIESFLESSEILVINIPPKLRNNSGENYVTKISNLIPYLKNSTIKNVLFVSSTSVFGDNNQIVTDKTNPNPDTISGQQLFEIEKILFNETSFQTTILRFGGLIGNDRHPIKFLSGKSNIENPDAPINLIHQEDCIQIIIQILVQEKWNAIYNAVAPYHPSRKDYYVSKAIAYHLPLPQFENSSISVGKTIVSDGITADLGYIFKGLL